MRLRRVREEFAGAVALDFRSFLLRPEPQTGRTLEQFRTYTQSWLRAAADPDGGTFRVWSTDAGPPSHSIPPHLVAKVAATYGPDAFDAMHERLLHAFFAENRDITDPSTLLELWSECGLPGGGLVRVAEPQFLEATIADHNEAVRLGVNGVPAVRADGNDVAVTGAQPLETYRRWVRRLLDAR